MQKKKGTEEKKVHKEAKWGGGTATATSTGTQDLSDDEEEPLNNGEIRFLPKYWRCRNATD